METAATAPATGSETRQDLATWPGRLNLAGAVATGLLHFVLLVVVTRAWGPRAPAPSTRRWPCS